MSFNTEIYELDIYRDEETLKYLYEEKRLTQTEIADIAQASASTISDWVNRYNLQRTMSDRIEKLQDQGWLIDKLVREHKYSQEIADDLGYSYKHTVKEYMNKYDMEEPHQNKSTLEYLVREEFMWIPQIADFFGKSEATIRKYIRKYSIKKPWKRKNLLEELYINEELSTAQIAERMPCTGATIGNAIDELGIQKRSLSQALRARYGYSTSVERGGPFIRKRKEILERDNYQCQDCGTTNDEHREKIGLGLNVHHIKPVDEFDYYNDAHTDDNMVTLCHWCHQSRHGR